MLRVPEKINFPEEEEKISEFWKESSTFLNSLKQSQTKPKFTFFDGPPFATGLPHYGHVLAGTIKDIVTRFAQQSGHHVGRRFGWDCHGLPVEYEIDKMLNITGPQDVEKLGISNYNAECRKIVMRYSKDWEFIMGRLARWVDFEYDYKTMYPWYMESIWFIFRELYFKGLVYRGVKVMPYSTACNTPLSNFESGQNYKEVVDPQVVVGFPLDDDPSVQLVAWTTTPWTLPSNLTLCVHPKLTYVKVISKKNGEKYILMESRLCMLFKKPNEYEIIEKFPGLRLANVTYQPLFPYFQHLRQKKAFRVLVDNYVSDDAGTGIVQQAPYFGEDDYRVCLAAGVITREQEIICPVDPSGRFTEPVKDFLGLYVKDADKEIIKYLKTNMPRRLLEAGQVKHSYPFCWRSETPLIYRAIPSWFVRVEHMVDSLLEASQQTYWVPDFVKEGRFGNWLRNARDWAISRNRYWGTPIPIWVSEDEKEIICVGSISELEALTGQKITDIHRESIDHLTIPSARPGMPPLRRVPEVFDCWFESGSMPYAQLHFPFSRDIEISFHDGFPADFIGEGIDQTRGWFYTLLVISTALFNKAPFKNLIANGLVLASDGQKMSKRKKNYPDPMEVVNKYGADALRLYLINSPVVRAENLRFKEEGVRDVLRDVLLPWYNAYRYLAQNIERLAKEENFKLEVKMGEIHHSSNTMDRWIKSATQTMVTTVWREMEKFHLYKVVPILLEFIDQLTNWYIRMNRKRLKGDFGVEDCTAGLITLFEVLYTFVEVMAPFTPYLSEIMFANLRRQLAADCADRTVNSVHWLQLPKPQSAHIDLIIERRIRHMQFVISTGRIIRDKRTVPVKYPLSELIVVHKEAEYLEDLKTLESYIIEELNIKSLVLSNDCEKFGVSLSVDVDHKALGARLKNDFKPVLTAVKGLNENQVREFLKTGSIDIMGHTLALSDVFVSYKFAENAVDKERYEIYGSQEAALLFNMERDASMQDEGLAREVVNLVQKLRKKSNLVPTDPITIFYEIQPSNTDFSSVILNYRSYIESLLKVPFCPKSSKHASSVVAQELCQMKGISASIQLEIVEGFIEGWKSLGEGEEKSRNSKKSPIKNTPVLKTVAPQPNGDSCLLVPSCRHVLVLLTTGVEAKQDPYGGLIIPLENPAGRNKKTLQEVKRKISEHFGIKEASFSLISVNGPVQDLSDSTVIYVVKNGGQLNKLPEVTLPNQPFIEVIYNESRAVVFLTDSKGKDLKFSDIVKTISDIYDLKKISVEVALRSNNPRNVLNLMVK